MKKMKKRRNTWIFVTLMLVLVFSQVCIAAVTAPSKAGYTIDLESHRVSTSMTSGTPDSWEKTYTFVGFEEYGIPMYCTVTEGLKDGIFSNTDYMWTGLKYDKRCDVATFVYVAGCVENSAGANSGWSPYITNGATAKKMSVKHSDTATYYVAFAMM